MKSKYDITIPILDVEWHKQALLEVTHNSKMKYKSIVEKFAYYFKREMHFDFLQFVKDEQPDTPYYIEYVAYIFLENNMDLKNIDDKTTSLGIGACCFRNRTNDSNEKNWCLDWIWIHPFCRRKGKLTKVWNFFIEKLGNFNIEYPLSLEMESFLKRRGWLPNS